MKNAKNIPYKPGDEGYNRQSGRKTLAFVGICLALIVCFFVLSLLSLK